jgi:hypothetical protein
MSIVTNSGAAFIFHGGSGGLSASPNQNLFGDQTASYMGASVACAGDVNGDGYSDVLVGAPTAGAAYLVLGGPSPVSGSLSDADAKYPGPVSGDSAGWSVAGAGDINGDTYQDMIIGAPDYDAGAAFVVFGGTSLTSLKSLADADVEYTGVYAEDAAGHSVASAGDVNDDGYDDVLVGANWNDDVGTNTGAVYLVLGGESPSSVSLSVADAEYTGSGWYENAGFSVAGAGDVDGDGYDDVLVGAHWNDDGGSTTGAAYLVNAGEKATVDRKPQRLSSPQSNAGQPTRIPTGRPGRPVPPRDSSVGGSRQPGLGTLVLPAGRLTAGAQGSSAAKEKFERTKPHVNVVLDATKKAQLVRPK